MFKRLTALLVCLTFIFSNLPSIHAQEFNLAQLPVPGSMVNISNSYVPMMLSGLSVHPENPLLIDFIVSTGNSEMDATQVKEQSDRLIKYFLACLTIPESEQWVNLSPYEKERIIPKDLGQTVLGRDMLAQDYLLKQLTASLIYPEKNIGKAFWDKVYARAREMYGTSQIPVNTFNKVWILPQYAKVYEHNNTVFVVKSHLRVMLDQDYLALKKHADVNSSVASEANPVQINNLGNQIVREIILPAIEEEVNTGKNFALMRQIYNSMILAVWFKNNLRQALLNQVYTDKSKINGVNVDDPAIREKIYKQYLRAYKKGVFNYIKEETDPVTQEIIPRKYFSGGLEPFDRSMLHQETAAQVPEDLVGTPEENKYFGVNIDILRQPGNTANNKDRAMVEIKPKSPQQITDEFQLPHSDAIYLSGLISKYRDPSPSPVLGVNGIASALLDQEAQQKFFGMVDGKEVMDDPANNDAAKDVRVRVLELKGGIGTTFKRLATLLRLTDRTTLADKATDSYFENVPVQGFDVSGQPKQFNEKISVAEMKLLNYIKLAQQNKYNEVEVQELVNPESQKAVSEFWGTTYLVDRVDDRIPADQKRTYRQVFSNDPVKGIKGLYFNPDFIVQGALPVVDAKTGAYLNNQALRSPGGHGAFVSLTMDENSRNQKDLSVPRITVFTNGDGVNNMLPPPVAGWMVRNKVPIAMVTTTKQLLDLKGGLITLLSNTQLPDAIREKLNRFETLSAEDIAGLQNSLYPYLLEIAQAKEAGQQDIFQKMGISIGEKSAQFFNTNVHAQNHNILDPFLAELRGIIGDQKFYEIIAPDLIVNPKDKELNKKPISVIQLEGASGSALLAMNRFIMTTKDPNIIALKQKYGITRLVYFVNFDEQSRSQVFTPEKYTWDHYLYAFTDLFSVDPQNGRLVFTPRPGRSTLPGLELDKPYEDLEYDINAFGRSLGVKGLDYLAIKGEVKLPNAILKGGVFIRNSSGKEVNLTDSSYQLPTQEGRLLLDNVFINIDKQGNLTTSPVTNVLDALQKFEQPDKAMLDKEPISIDDGNDVLANDQGIDRATISERQMELPERSAAVNLQKPAGKAVNPGGIDLNAGNLNMQSEGEKVNITFDPAQIAEFKRGDFSGVRFQILGVAPVNLMPLLGLISPPGS